MAPWRADFDRECLRCGRRTDASLAIDTRCEECEEAFRTEAPNWIWRVMRAAPVAAINGIVLGLAGGILGLVVKMPIAAALFGFAFGASWGGHRFDNALEGRRRLKFLRSPTLPRARLVRGGREDD